MRIICNNFSAKGVKSVIMQTQGSQEVLSNIVAIFGSRQAADIVPLKTAFGEGQLEAENLSEQSLMAELQTEANESMQITADDVARLKAAHFQLEGFVSKCEHGLGRSSKDRQYFYVNDRPCDPKNVRIGFDYKSCYFLSVYI